MPTTKTTVERLSPELLRVKCGECSSVHDINSNDGETFDVTTIPGKPSKDEHKTPKPKKIKSRFFPSANTEDED